MKDEWRPIAGFGDAYAVSGDGRVMRVAPRNLWWRKAKNARKHKPFCPSPCRSYLNRGGYYQVRIGPMGAQKTVSVHQLVARAFVPNPLGLTEVNHRDGNKTNNVVENLEWVTHSQNLRHAAAAGLLTIRRGSEKPLSKLTEAAVLAIREDGRTQSQIAKDYGVDQTLISMVKRRAIWRHVSG